MNKNILVGVLAGFLFGAVVSTAQATSSAVVLVYHRFGEPDFASTNTTVRQLDSHIAELTTGKYNVLSLKNIVSKMVLDGLS